MSKKTWRLKCKAVADRLQEVGGWLFTFTKLPLSQWKSAHTKKRSAAPRGVQAPHQDPDGPAFAETTAMAVLGIARRRSDHHSQSQRMAERSAPSSLIPPLTSPRDPIFLRDRRSRQSQSQHKIVTPPCDVDGQIAAKTSRPASALT